jgi:DNA repair exonuclease SbcCD ATPase subunit
MHGLYVAGIVATTSIAAASAAAFTAVSHRKAQSLEFDGKLKQAEALATAAQQAQLKQQSLEIGSILTQAASQLELHLRFSEAQLESKLTRAAAQMQQQLGQQLDAQEATQHAQHEQAAGRLTQEAAQMQMQLTQQRLDFESKLTQAAAEFERKDAARMQQLDSKLTQSAGQAAAQILEFDRKDAARMQQLESKLTQATAQLQKQCTDRHDIANARIVDSSELNLAAYAKVNHEASCAGDAALARVNILDQGLKNAEAEVEATCTRIFAKHAAEMRQSIIEEIGQRAGDVSDSGADDAATEEVVKPARPPPPAAAGRRRALKPIGKLH